MTGVEILAMEEVLVESAFNQPAAFITFGVVFILFIILGVCSSIHLYDWSNFVISLFMGIFLGLTFGIIVGHALSAPLEYETQYKVTISDEVTMNDFLEKYEIIDQEGKIYTVRERNDEK